MTVSNELQTRVERLEQHVGVSESELAWQDYIEQFAGYHEEILGTGRGTTHCVTVLAEELHVKSEWKNHFTNLSVSPHNSELIEIMACAPPDWREKLKNKQEKL